MKFRIERWAPVTLALCLVAGSVCAQSEEEPRRKAAAPAATASGVAARAPKPWVPTADKKALVDINSARPADLAKLPGMSPELAAKVVAGRPYGSKMHLVTRNVLPPEVFDAVRAHVVARQPYKDQAKNVEALKKAGKATP